MSELTTSAVAPGQAAQPEPWNPSGSMIAVLLASLALFFVGSVFTLIGACVLTSFVDVPH